MLVSGLSMDNSNALLPDRRNIMLTLFKFECIHRNVVQIEYSNLM